MPTPDEPPLLMLPGTMFQPEGSAAGLRQIRIAFANVDAALERMYEVKDGKINPFLHLSMHLSVSEQCSIDQPRGIRQAVELLTARRDSLHDAHHETMDALGKMIWESQRSGRPPDGHAYIDAVQRRATQD
jgi:hypothetical protein